MTNLIISCLIISLFSISNFHSLSSLGRQSSTDTALVGRQGINFHYIPSYEECKQKITYFAENLFFYNINVSSSIITPTASSSRETLHLVRVNSVDISSYSVLLFYHPSRFVMCSPWGQQVLILILIFLDRQGIIDEPHSLENTPKCVQISFSPIQNTRFLQQTMDAWGVMGLWGDFDDGTHIDALKCDVIKLLMECKLFGDVNRRNSIINNTSSYSVSVIPPNRVIFSIQLRLILEW